MKAANFESVDKIVLVFRNSVDFDKEIIGYVPVTAEIKRFLENNLDFGSAVSSFILIKPRVFTGTGVTYAQQPLAAWDTEDAMAYSIAASQLFYVTQPTLELQTAYKTNNPL